MKVLLTGYGKMGRLLEAKLLERGHEVSAAVDPYGGEKTIGGAPVYKSIDALDLLWGELDAAMEFTLPSTAASNIKALVSRGIPVVAGTTGWYEKLPEIEALVKQAGTALIWAPNFSLGVNLFYRIAAHAAKLADPFAEYDVGGYETHHNKKADSPSGTAKALVERVLSRMTRKTKAVYETLNRPPLGEELHYASLRVGSVPGLHSLVLDSPADTIEITHSARNREGFALGAVNAAEWLTAQKRTGIFTIDQMLADIVGAAD
jgi:4-hydroxy-tetrahydrodipicolinate reductase